ncbi:acyl-CoA/acyl-ACP dehydrogenase [candidate division KSB1 bacterium]|nr:acyl-CoA/acyl-ACP dehydrogenase [candidate division KSB1 bacterium]
MDSLKTLPSDDLRAVLWRFADRYDLQMLIQSVRAVARGPVARAVANGARNSHEWTKEKADLLDAFDESGITALFMEPARGGYIEGPKNLALALTAFELSWVDAGAATCSLAGNLALEPIHERGTDAQKDRYMIGAVPPQPGEERTILRGAFGLTEPLPYVGVETGMLGGKVRVAEWPEKGEPLLQIDKRGRFITNMDFANFVCVAVDSDDERIKGSCMVILEEGDPGTFDRGAPTLKLVHQLSSTRDPVFNMRVPANRIIGGYRIKDGVLIPNFSHSEIIEAVFKRTRVTVALMSAAKLLSAVEPIIRYQRGRFRGGNLEPGSPRYELGIQQKDDAVHRLASIWAMGEASASLGFAAARIFDDLDPLEKEKDRLFRDLGVERGRQEMKELMKHQDKVVTAIDADQDLSDADVLLRYIQIDALANVLCPASKLWCTGQGATVMREAVSLMGGYGITEDCPGFLGQKWMDAQLEATYEGPEAVQRRQLTFTMTQPVFLATVRSWMRQLTRIEKKIPGIGAETTAKSFELWLTTLEFLQTHKDENGAKLYSSSRQGTTFQLADALSWLLASFYQIQDLHHLMTAGNESPALADELPSASAFLVDLCLIQAVKASGEAARLMAELFYGYIWEAEATQRFTDLRCGMERLIKGVGEAKTRAGRSLAAVMIPEALDYPQ